MVPFTDQFTVALVNEFAPKFFMVADTEIVAAQTEEAGEASALMPASLFTLALNSSAPILGVVVLLVCPSISLVIPANGVPAVANDELETCKSVVVFV